MPITRRELFEVWMTGNTNSNKNSLVIEYVFDAFGLNINEGSKNTKNISQVVRTMCSRFKKKWHDANRTKEVFESRYSQWLTESVDFSPEEEEPSANTSCGSSRYQGRPAKTFSESGDRSQLKKISHLVQSTSKEELLLATRVSLYNSGKRDAAQILQSLEESPTRATKMKKIVSCPTASPIPYTPEEALALFVDCGLTKNQYMLMQSGAKSRNANIYPPYYVLQEAKKRCYRYV